MANKTAVSSPEEHSVVHPLLVEDAFIDQVFLECLEDMELSDCKIS